MRWILRVLLVLLLMPFVVLGLLALVPERWLADSMERFASRSTGTDVRIGQLSLEVFSVTPGLALSDVRVAEGNQGQLLEGADASVSIALPELLKARLVIDEIRLSGGTASIVRFEDGSGNWEVLIPEPSDEPVDDQSASMPLIRQLTIDRFRLQFDDRFSDRQLDVLIDGQGSTTQPDEPLTLSVEGDYNALPVTLDLSVRVPEGLALDPAEIALVQWDIGASLAETTASVDGQVTSLQPIEGLDSSLSFRAPNTRALSALAGQPLPELPALSFDGTLKKDDDEFLIRRYTGSLGENDVQGDIRINPSTTPLTAFVNADADRLDLDALLSALAPESADDGQDAAATADRAEADSAPLLSEETFDLRSLTQAFNGALRVTVQEVQSESIPIESVDIRLEVKGQQVRLVPLDIGVGGGSIEAEVSLDASTGGADGEAEFHVRRVDVQTVLETLGIEGVDLGRVGGRGKYWINGNSVASLARSADGGLFLLMTGGKLDALLVELAGIDLMESFQELIDFEQDQTPIECAFLDLLSESGVTSIERMVLGTADTVFIADGQFDANTGQFEITIEPHPKDASLISARTSVTISGSPDDIDIAPGPELPARAAAIAVLGAIASPAAALLPLLETGGARDSEYCNGLVGSLDE